MENSGSELMGNLLEQNIKLQHPKLWELNEPNLYTALTQVFVDGELVDSYQTRFGVRTIELRPDDGFYLNGKKVMIQGVCLHHDLGPLGGASHKRGYERQIRLMKDMGVNAIRTSHNMPAPELIEACNEMGMMVMAESFDEWARPKVKNGYHLYFEQWADRDLTNLARAFRNDPSIVMWSIGNEIDEQVTPGGNKVAYFLQSVLTGRIQTGSYTNKDGQRVYTTDIVAEDQEFAESKNAESGNAGGYNTQPAPAPQSGNDGFMPAGDDSELPFV